MEVLVDKSNNKTDVPHDYIELDNPVQAQLHKTGKHSYAYRQICHQRLSGFWQWQWRKPDTVKHFIVLRTEKDKRSAWIKWGPVDNAYAYNIYTGIAPDKLYNCIMVHGSNEYYFKAMDKSLPYYFTIEAINENGVSKRTQIIKVE